MSMFKFIKNKKFILLLIFLGVFSFSSMVLALEITWPNSPAGTPLTTDSTITDLIKYLYEWGIALGGLIAFVALIIAGFGYLTSVGDPTKMKEAMSRIQSAILGLILLLSSWLILHTINPELTTLRDIKFKPEDMPKIEIPDEKLIIPVEPCVKAMIFEEPNFTGKRYLMSPGDKKTTGDLEFKPMSFKFCREMTKEEIKKIREPDDRCQEIEERNLIQGGSCTLQLFDGGFWDFGCGGPVVELFGPEEKNFDNVMGIEVIKCLELVDRVAGYPQN